MSPAHCQLVTLCLAAVGISTQPPKNCSMLAPASIVDDRNSPTGRFQRAVTIVATFPACSHHCCNIPSVTVVGLHHHDLAKKNPNTKISWSLVAAKTITGSNKNHVSLQMDATKKSPDATKFLAGYSKNKVDTDKNDSTVSGSSTG